MFAYMFTISGVLHLYPKIKFSYYYCVSLDWKTSFIISVSTGLLMNSLGFHLSEKVLISPSYLKNLFPRDREFWVETCFLFLFNTLKCCPTDSWCPLFLMRTHLSSCYCSPKHSASANSDCFQDFLFILCFQYSDHDTTTCDFSLYLSSLGFTELLESVNCVYLQILKTPVTFSLSSFPSPSLSSLLGSQIHMLNLVMLFHRSLRFCSVVYFLFKIFFPLSFSKWIIAIDLFSDK